MIEVLNIVSMMAKWLIAFVLLMIVTGNVLAGIPMPSHSDEQECPITGMMDCCKKAQMNAETPEVRSAQLCCVLNCNEPGPTAPTGTYNASPLPAVALSGALIPRYSTFSNPGLVRSNSPPGLQRGTHPAYIRHLALLI